MITIWKKITFHFIFCFFSYQLKEMILSLPLLNTSDTKLWNYILFRTIILQTISPVMSFILIRDLYLWPNLNFVYTLEFLVIKQTTPITTIIDPPIVVALCQTRLKLNTIYLNRPIYRKRIKPYFLHKNEYQTWLIVDFLFYF